MSSIKEFENILIVGIGLIGGSIAKKIKDNFKNSRLIYIPEIYWQYVTKNILVMERTFATPINDREELKRQGVNFEKLATNAVESFFYTSF